MLLYSAGFGNCLCQFWRCDTRMLLPSSIAWESRNLSQVHIQIGLQKLINSINFIYSLCSSDKKYAVFQLLYPLVHAIQPYLVPICFCLTWGLIILFFLTLGSAVKEGVANAKRMHQIPCTDCRFFTNDYRLKCTVHPSIANSEEAIDCSDYCPRNNRVTAA